MAYCDYTHCSVCDSKVYYDAEVEYPENIKIIALSEECSLKYNILIDHISSEAEQC